MARPNPCPNPCPCGASQGYEACCGSLHQHFRQTGHLRAETAEALMRSRYTAYVKNELPYLLATWHPSTRPAALEPNEPGLRWLGLDVLQHQQQDASHATVRFVARSKLGGRAHRLTETSRFERVDGQWLYVDGSA